MLLMKSNKEDFLKPLQSVAGIVERRHTLPILSNVLIQIEKSELSMIATDLELEITCKTALPKEYDSAAITVSAKKLQDIVKALPDESEVSFDSKESRLQIKAGKSQFNLQTLPAEDFPKLSLTDETEAEFAIPQAQLRHLFSQVQYAMAQQDIRYYLNGLLLIVEPGIIKVVATDGHRLCLASADVPSIQHTAEAILPRKTVIELIKLLTSNADDEIQISLGKNKVTFNFSNIKLVSKVIEGKFPDYNKVIPSHQNHVLLDRVTLLRATQRAAILSNEKVRGVRLVLTQNSLRVICNNAEQEEAEEEIAIDYSNEALDIGFNVTYLLDVLNNLECSEINCSFGGANSSCLISIPGNTHFKYVVMPMRI